jgi:hypothetical protein
MKRVIKGGLLTLTLSVLYLTSPNAVGQQPPTGSDKGQERPGATTDPLDGFPAQSEVAHVSFSDPRTGGELLSIVIYPESKNSPVVRPGTYYHRPLFAFRTNTKSIPGCPPSVLDERPQADGSAYLDFAVTLTTNNLKTVCRNAVLLEDRENALSAAKEEHRVVVRPWPLRDLMFVVCRDKDTHKVLATTRVPIQTREEVPFTLHFTKDDLAVFKEKAAPNQVVMDFYYHYLSISTGKGTVDIKGDKDISVVLRDVLGSRSGVRPGPGMPVFQEERRRIERLVSARVERIISADPDVLALLQVQTPVLVDRLLTSEDEKALDYETLANKFGRKEFDLQLAAYLKPIVARINETDTDSKSEIKIHEDEVGRNRASGGGAVLFSVGNFQATDEQRKRALDRLEKESGTTLTKVQGKEFYEPHLIRVTTVRDGWDQVKFDEKTVVYLSRGTENQYLTTQGVPIGFTKDLAERSIGAVRERETYEGVPMGTVMMWWGDKGSLPPGWELCDGNQVTTPGAIRTGIKPNLVDRFPKGAVADRSTVQQLTSVGSGGSNNMPALKISNLSALKTDVAGSHTHALARCILDGYKDEGGAEVSLFNNRFADPGMGMKPAGDHQHLLHGHVGTESGVNADGGDITGANQPAYQEIFFIIRVK